MLAAWEVRGRDTESLAPEETAPPHRPDVAGTDRFRRWVCVLDRFQEEACPRIPRARGGVQHRSPEGAANGTPKHARDRGRPVRQRHPPVIPVLGIEPHRPVGEQVDAFEEHCATVETRFSGVYSLRRLRNRTHPLANGGTGLTDELVGHLATSVSGQFMRPRRPTGLEWFYLDVLISPSWRQDDLDDIFRINGRWAAVVAVDGYPPYTEPGALEVLQGFGFDYQWTSRFICLGRARGRTELHRAGDSGHRANGHSRPRHWRSTTRPWIRTRRRWRQIPSRAWPRSTPAISPTA